MGRVVFAICCVAASLAASQPEPPAAIGAARISPDGQWIAFSRQSGGTPLGLFTITIGGQDEVRVAPPDGMISDIRWSPRGDAIVYFSQSTGSLRTVPAAGGTPRSIAPSEAPPLPRPMAPNTAIVTVHDARIMFVTPVGADQQALTLTNGKETWIDLVGPSGNRVTVMPPGLARIVEPPSWSDDGRWFAVMGSPSEGESPQIFSGSLPRPQPTGYNMGAVPPMVRQVTGTVR